MVISELIALLAPENPPSHILAVLAPHVQRLLAEVEVEHPITTGELGQRFFPIEAARGDGLTARGRLYKVLTYGASRQLGDYARRGPARRMKGTRQMIRPWLWAPYGSPNDDAIAEARRIAEVKITRELERIRDYALKRLGETDTNRIVQLVLHVKQETAG